MRSPFRLAVFVIVSSLLCFAFAGDGKWLQHVPEKERTRSNPFAAEPEVRDAGAKLFRQHCAECHGADALGRDGRPGLTSGRVRHASDGELQWILRNGSLRNGMPAWSSLPEQQRWQIVSYLRSLQDGKPAR